MSLVFLNHIYIYICVYMYVCMYGINTFLESITLDLMIPAETCKISSLIVSLSNKCYIVVTDELLTLQKQI